MKKYKFTLIFIILIISINRILAQYSITHSVFGNGTAKIASKNYNINCTVGQSVSGTCDEASYIHKIGYWYSIDWIVSDIVDNSILIPNKYKLYQNCPNPFNPETIIRYALPQISNVRIDVYNLLGQRVSTLVNNSVSAGYHEIKFNGSHLPSGYYTYRIQTDGYHEVKKMMLIK